jgi:hypothetical protein
MTKGILPAAEEEPQHRYHTGGRQSKRHYELAEHVGGLRRFSTQRQGHSGRQQLRRNPFHLRVAAPME